MCVGLMRCDQGCGFKDSKEEGSTSCKIGQLTCNMGLERRKICIHASKAATPSKGFLHLEAHMLKSLDIVQYCINTVFFSPLLVKNKPREGVMNVHLYLDVFMAAAEGDRFIPVYTLSCSVS
jgi:hypothetical protein